MRFVDANVFVYHLVDDPKNGDRATRILQSVESGENTITSTLPIAQVCGYLKWKKRERTIPVFLELIRSLTSMKKIETEFVDFVEANDAQKQLRISWRTWDDLVIVSQMKRMGVTEIYSQDSDFDLIPGIRRIF